MVPYPRPCVVQYTPYPIPCVAQYTRAPDERPYAALVWSGSGTVNGRIVDVAVLAQREFLVTPQSAVTFVATSATPLLIYSVFPILEMPTC